MVSFFFFFFTIRLREIVWKMIFREREWGGGGERVREIGGER